MYEPVHLTEEADGSALTRRRLVQMGAAGAATFWLGSRVEGLAQAATAGNGLKRSDYLALTDSGFTASVDGGSRALRLTAVEDLPVATQVASLRDSEDAFTLLFSGDARGGFEQGTRQLSHPQLGKVDLFLVPVERRTNDDQTYEAIVDRTVKIPGLEDDGAPKPANPGQRGEQPSRRSAVARRSPTLRRAALRRTNSRRLLADVQLANAAGVASVRASLLRRGRVVATASAGSKRGHSLLRFGTRAPLNAASYELSLVTIGADGTATTLRKAVRLSG